MLIRCLSVERFSSYRLNAQESDLDVLVRYAWNIALSESLYPLLHYLEIMLRNALYEAINADTSDSQWYERSKGILFFDEQEKVDAAIGELRRNGKVVSPGRVVAELSFGFWTSLLNARYERQQRLWPRLLQTAFPAMPRRIRTRSTVSNRFQDIRGLRNRIFHHEPIWQYRDLQRRHAELLEAVSWIDHRVGVIVQSFDRFPSVYQISPYDMRAQIELYLKAKGYQV